MAITIRTGANGSYKSAYVAYFVILPALRSGRCVVTNFEGMQPLEKIEELFDEKFPETTKLIRISSRNVKGLDLWRYWYCWCPLNALIVIDECQDIFSKNTGFKMEKFNYKPVSEFKDSLPDGYENFFNSRHVPVDMDNLQPCDIDDTGAAEYDDQGRIIYPTTFNEGFMRHRKFNWDIELLSPDWKQIDSNVKACAEECFFHKNRDGLKLFARKPYIFKHSKTVATPAIPEKRDVNLTSVKVPLDAHLLYKSTGTGLTTKSGGTNLLLKSPKFLFAVTAIILSVGYFIYAITDIYNRNSETDTQSPEVEQVKQSDVSSENENIQSSKDGRVLCDGRDSDQDCEQSSDNAFYLNDVPTFLDIADLSTVYVTSRVVKYGGVGEYPIEVNLSLEVSTFNGGQFYVTERYLDYLNVTYQFIDDCMLLLTKGDQNALIGCPNSGGSTSSVQVNNDIEISAANTLGI